MSVLCLSVSVTLHAGPLRTSISPGRPTPAPSSSTDTRRGFGLKNAWQIGLRMNRESTTAEGQTWWPTPAPSYATSLTATGSPSSNSKLSSAPVKYGSRGQAFSVEVTAPKNCSPEPLPVQFVARLLPTAERGR
eukprot:1716644-Prymnesium_polylepis.1